MDRSAEAKLNGIAGREGRHDRVHSRRAERFRERWIHLAPVMKVRRATWSAKDELRGTVAGAAECLGALRTGAAPRPTSSRLSIEGALR